MKISAPLSLSSADKGNLHGLLPRKGLPIPAHALAPVAKEHLPREIGGVIKVPINTKARTILGKQLVQEASFMTCSIRVILMFAAQTTHADEIHKSILLLFSAWQQTRYGLAT